MKFIQIASMGVGNTRNTQCDWILHALTDDGRIFEITNVSDWHELALPQEQQPSVYPAQETKLTPAEEESLRERSDLMHRPAEY